MSLFITRGGRTAPHYRRGQEGWRIGLTKPTITARKKKRRRAAVLAKASRARNRS